MTSYNDPFRKTFADDLTDSVMWELHLKHKTHGKIRDERDKNLFDMIRGGRCTKLSSELVSGGYSFGKPVRLLLNKPGSTKKRVTYTFNKKDDNIDNVLLSFTANLLRRYDDLFAPNLYSYRNKESVRTAVQRLRNVKDLDQKYVYKVDVSNYFNSIDVDVLLNEIRDDIDETSFGIISSILLNPEVIFRGKVIIDEQKGVMAGIPISSFLANYYMKDLDWYFHEKGVLYCRFADDIIVFADTEEECFEHSSLSTL